MQSDPCSANRGCFESDSSQQPGATTFHLSLKSTSSLRVSERGVERVRSTDISQSKKAKQYLWLRLRTSNWCLKSFEMSQLQHEYARKWRLVFIYLAILLVTSCWWKLLSVVHRLNNFLHVIYHHFLSHVNLKSIRIKCNVFRATVYIYFFLSPFCKSRKSVKMP